MRPAIGPLAPEHPHSNAVPVFLTHAQITPEAENPDEELFAFP